MSSRAERRVRWAVVLAPAIAWAAAVGLWLAEALGRPAPAPVARAVVGTAAALTVALVAAWVVRSARRARTERRFAPLVPPLLLVLALGVRFVGLDHEVAEGYYLDEGTYSHHAAQINRGRVLQRDFVYPHLLYYLDAFALWAGRLFRGEVTGALGLLYGLEPGEGTRRMLLRGVVALLGALTVLPVHALGRWLGRSGGAGGGARAAWSGALAGLLIVVSPLYNDGSHLAICDVPSAFFAVLCLAATARLVDRESVGRYALAGAAAGLAAAAKYPAGLVAVAPAAIWLLLRVPAGRRFLRVEGVPGRGSAWGLAVAAASSLATFLATNPGLLVYPEEAFAGRRSLFFGSSQYGGEGWFGAVPPSATLWYAGQLAWSFGLPALLAGAAGLALLPAAGRRRLVALSPFPVLYLALICSLDVVVARNLYPALPPLAAFGGAGIAALLASGLALAARRAGAPGGPGPARAALGMDAAALVAGALLLAPPVVRTIYQEIGLARPGTRVVAREWVRENVPRGASILREAYTPDFDPAEYDAERRRGQRFVAALPVEAIAPAGYDFVLVSTGAHRRFFAEQGNATGRELAMRERYRTIFRDFPLVARFPGSRTRRGPGLRLYAVPPGDVPVRRARLFEPEELFVPDGRMRRREPGVVTVFEESQWLLAREWLEAGSFRVRARGAVGGTGEVVVRTRDGTEVARSAIVGGFGRVELPRPDRYFLYFDLPPGSRVEAVGVAASSQRSR